MPGLKDMSMQQPGNINKRYILHDLRLLDISNAIYYKHVTFQRV